MRRQREAVHRTLAAAGRELDCDAARLLLQKVQLIPLRGGETSIGTWRT